MPIKGRKRGVAVGAPRGVFVGRGARLITSSPAMFPVNKPAGVQAVKRVAKIKATIKTV
jgi:hypothetical protein